MGDSTGWKTKTAAILTGIVGLLGVILHFIAGPDATGAMDVVPGILTMLGGFGLYSVRDAITKLLVK